jgi:OmcA/MtrC family decaheme c-type cytochrome
VFRYTFPPELAIPAAAQGSYAVGLEGYLVVSGARVPAFAPVAYIAVTDSEPAPRRSVVSSAACDRCHGELRAHGGGRTNPDYCAMCHNPGLTNSGRVARLEGATVVAESLDFKVMIHRIHRGEDRARDYILGGFPAPSRANPAGTPVAFGPYPGDLRDCESCHDSGTYGLPSAATPSTYERLTCTEPPADDGDEYCDIRDSTSWQVPPIAAVCTSCHDAEATAAHAEVMTSTAGVESCATCHGPGSAFDMAAAHALTP